MNILILGAASRIAECTARALITTHPHAQLRFLLVGRDSRRLAPVAADLVASGGGRVAASVHAADLEHVGQAPTLVAECFDILGQVDLALIAHGTLPDQTAAECDPVLAERTLMVNGLSPVLLAERIVEHMVERKNGTLVVIGSVAGDRGRKSNYLYGAAKGLVDRHLEGLRHRLHGTPVHVMLVKPGPTRTPMTAGLGMAEGRLAAPEQVAGCIVRGIARRHGVIYAPGKWRLIMLIIRHLPSVIFNRLSI